MLRIIYSNDSITQDKQMPLLANSHQFAISQYNPRFLRFLAEHLFEPDENLFAIIHFYQKKKKNL